MYLYFKALHIISMVAWFAGLFYIFRLYVYHVKFRDNREMARAYELMESKLLNIIMRPAAVLTVLFGLGMLRLNPVVWHAGWLHAKLLFVIVLILYHGFSVKVHERFAKSDYFLSEKACRWFNEIPTLVLIVVVILAVVKPF